MKFDVDERTILMVRHGSNAYGTNIATSDEDFKGVCIPPKEFHLGFLHTFAQYERMANKGHEADVVVYALKKFVGLAADCNPNIIEVLHVDDRDIIKMDHFGGTLRESRDLFLSRKARHTFSGYAHAQLKRIKSHRAWLLNPPTEPPSRKEFGLPEERKVSKGELGAFDALGDEVEVLPKDVVRLFVAEKAYAAKMTQYKQYQNWLKTRNPKRAELEAKHGYDTKHGMHLLRLMRMCKEILEGKGVLVRRPDAEELLSVRFGKKSYDELIEEAEALDAECGELYKTSPLPHKPDREALDGLVIRMTEEYLRLNG
jgi:predicted nucleotidyltransferase